ncbi:MAG: hypothetical protein ACRDMI_13370 [Streptosporangiaceae bacterium]
MTLPASQQHALDAINEVLQSAEPQLATMFGVFTDLTRLEAMPPAETLSPGPWWTRYRLPGRRYRPGRQHRPRGRRAGRRLGRMVLVPLLLIAAVSLLIVSLVSAGPTGRRGCGQTVVMAMGARLRTTASTAAGTGGAAGMGGTGCRAVSPQPAGGSR